MLHADFVQIDERFSDRETTDREMFLDNETVQSKVEEMKNRVANATNLTEIYESLELK